MCPTGTSPRPATYTPEFRRAFDLIDSDGDGKISGNDLRRFYSAVLGVGDGGDEESIQAMIAIADANNDGYVQYDEFQRVLKVKKKKSNGKSVVDEGKENGYGDSWVMEEVFKAMDQDGDGRLGLDDLRCYLVRAGIEVDDEEVKAMIRMGGGDDERGVSFDGLVSILAVNDLVC